MIQILYLWDVQGPDGSLSDAMNAVLKTRNVSPERIPLISWYVAQLTDRLDEVDQALEACMDNWRLERLSRVDRAVLRTATAEILFSEDVPPKVAIQEGIRLAGQYGGSESPRFVNGVLDAVYRSRSGPRSDT